jgi:chromosome segregation ATPase
MTDDEPGAWLPLAAASRALDVTVDALRKRVVTREIQARKDNKNRWLVRVPADLAAASEPLADDWTTASLREDLAKARAELAAVRAELNATQGKLTDALVAAGRAEERAAGKDALIAALERQLEHERALAARPWWRKLLGN